MQHTISDTSSIIFFSHAIFLGPPILSMMKMIYNSSIKADEVFTEWIRTYKDIFAFKQMGSPPVVMITNLDWIKLLFIHNADHFSNRPSHMWLVNQLIKGKGEFSKFYFKYISITFQKQNLALSRVIVPNNILVKGTPRAS